MNNRNTAVTPNGNGKSQVDISNMIQGQHELRAKFTVAAAAGNKADIIIKPAFWRKASELALPAGITFSSDGFASWEEFYTYFRHVSTHIFGLRIEAAGDTGVENFNGGYFTFREKLPTGEVKPVKFNVSKFREPLSTSQGYSETVSIPGVDEGKGFLKFLMWNGLDVMWNGIKDGDSLEFIFNIEGWDKARKLERIPAAII